MKDSMLYKQAIYCVAHCYNAPMPDDRLPTLSVLELTQSGSELKLIQQINLPHGTLMPISQAINSDGTRLFTAAGIHGIACYELDPMDQGKVNGSAVCSAVTEEPLATPYGAMPVDICLDKCEENLFVCNFLSGTVSAMSVDREIRSLGRPRVCELKHAGIPEKVRLLGPSVAAKELKFPEGFPEDASHPHGVACHPDGQWLVVCDLGTNRLSVFSLPVGKSFHSGQPEFVLQAHCAPASNRHYGAGTRQIRFSPDGRFLFSVNELDHTVSSYCFDVLSGGLKPVGAPQMTVPQDWLDNIPARPYMYNAQPNYNAGIAISPDGRHLYSSGRGNDTVAGFAIGRDGSLTPTRQWLVPSGGRTPWSISFLNDEYLLVTNQNADDPAAREPGGPDSNPERLAPLAREPGNLIVMRRDREDGSIRPSGAVWNAPHVISVDVGPPQRSTLSATINAT